jgi:hypothetical protein
MKHFWNQGYDIVLLTASISFGLCGMPVNPDQIKNVILGVCGICLYWFFEKK